MYNILLRILNFPCIPSKVKPIARVSFFSLCKNEKNNNSCLKMHCIYWNIMHIFFPPKISRIGHKLYSHIFNFVRYFTRSYHKKLLCTDTRLFHHVSRTMKYREKEVWMEFILYLTTDTEQLRCFLHVHYQKAREMWKHSKLIPVKWHFYQCSAIVSTAVKILLI